MISVFLKHPVHHKAYEIFQILYICVCVCVCIYIYIYIHVYIYMCVCVCVWEREVVHGAPCYCESRKCCDIMNLADVNRDKNLWSDEFKFLFMNLVTKIRMIIWKVSLNWKRIIRIRNSGKKMRECMFYKYNTNTRVNLSINGVLFFYHYSLYFLRQALSLLISLSLCFVQCIFLVFLRHMIYLVTFQEF